MLKETYVYNYNYHQSRMDNPETLTTLDTQDTARTQIKQNITQKTKQMNNTEVNPWVPEGYGGEHRGA